MTMTATETIIVFAVEQAASRALGPIAGLVSKYHRAHFLLLSRALREAKRDERLQEAIFAVRENLQKWILAVQKALAGIPVRPEPPSSDFSFLLDEVKAAKLQHRVELYTKGLHSIIEMLTEWIAALRRVLAQTKAELVKIERRLNNKDVKVGGLRALSNHSRGTEIDMLRLFELPKLGKLRGRVSSRLKVYRRAAGLSSAR